MQETLAAIHNHLTKLIAQIQAAVPNDEPFGNAHGNWSFPGLTRAELIEEAQSLIDLINEHPTDEIGASEGRLSDYVRRLQHLTTQTASQLWGNAGQAVPAYLLTLDGLRKALQPALKSNEQQEAMSKLRKLNTQLRGMEARLRELEPRTNSLSDMVGRIEKAYDAADQLPADLEMLSEARKKITDLEQAASKDQARLLNMRESAEGIRKELKQASEDAKSVLQQCETAYSAATSVGLAAAFTERSSALSKSMWIWVGGLVVALGAGSYFGSRRLDALSSLLKVPDVATPVIVLNLLLSILSIAAPVWFAWLATKQIGQRFRLAEDYAFKASVSRAYEGFRREAARHDDDMQVRLLASALTRLDEQPLRLVESHSHGSPLHELASSDAVKHALEAIPGFGNQVKDLAARAISAVTPSSRVSGQASPTPVSEAAE